jgi:hypothetical protein
MRSLSVESFAVVLSDLNVLLSWSVLLSFQVIESNLLCVLQTIIFRGSHVAIASAFKRKNVMVLVNIMIFL